MPYFVFAEFLEMCENLQKETTQLVEMPNLRVRERVERELQSKRIEIASMKLAKEFFEKEKSNSTKSKIDFIDQHVRFLVYPLLMWLQSFQYSTFS